MPDDPCGYPDWRALKPAQRNALVWRLAREAHAERGRAIAKALRTAFERMSRLAAPANAPTCARR